MLHKFSRTELLIGKEGLELLRNSHVAVFGLGGVGSYTVEALARAGIGRLTLVDFDEVCLTNVNRQLIALKSTVGKSKVEVMASRVKEINDKCEVEAIKSFYTPENKDELLKNYSYVVDAIDTIDQKTDLVINCLQRNLPIVSCMGTGNKLDPTQFKVTDISKTHTDPLAKSIRVALRKAGFNRGLKCVFSPEPPVPLKESEGDCRKNCICPNKGSQEFHCTMRRQIPGSISYIPSVAGLILAGVVVNDLVAPVLSENVQGGGD